MDMERLLVDREGLGMEEDTARREEVDSFGSAEEGDNHQSWIVGAQKTPLLILAGPSLLLKSCLYSNCPFHSVWECGVGAQSALHRTHTVGPTGPNSAVAAAADSHFDVTGSGCHLRICDDWRNNVWRKISTSCLVA